MADENSLIAGKRCLVLDDEFLIALDIQQLLENAGAASVLSVSTAGDALAALCNGAQFDLAVLDVDLGVRNRSGLTVANALAKRQMPFVFLTGLDAKDVPTKEFPAAPVVEKPYQTAVLLAALVAALRGALRGPR